MTALRPESVLLNWLIALPFFAALCAAIFPRLRVQGRPAEEAESLRRGPFALGAMASLMGVSLAVALLPGIPERGAIGTDYWWTRDLYHLRFRADVLAGVLVLGVHALGLLIHLQAAGLPGQGQSHRRASLLLAAQGCAAAACLSADLIALVFFLQLTVIALWLMARQRHEGAADHLLATAHTLGLLFLGAALLLWHRAGETSTGALPFLVMAVEPGALPAIGSLAILGLLPLIVGVPVHGWLPHLATRAPGAARASAVLLPLVGGAALVRVVPGLLDSPAVPALRPLGVGLGLAALSWGAIRALLARELGLLAAWLTVTQAGHLLIAAGVAASPNAVPEFASAAALQLVAAPLGVLAVWSAAGAIKAVAGTDAIAGLSRLTRRAPLAGVALMLGGASLSGVPPLPGFLVQRMLAASLLATGQVWLAIAVVCGDLLVAFAVLNALRLVFLRREPPPRSQWSSPWLSLQLGLVTLALLGSSLAAEPLVGWSHGSVRAALSAGGPFIP